ncbi:FecR family protein [Balneatrix alpica]|uniref:FecR domain-containing protein n=1 Tax=Balneatrix alpica TaxID=75684 RepID=A0ABV5ZF16_9GAMM|nr:FecR family protein [Balneatrix alpica]
MMKYIFLAAIIALLSFKAVSADENIIGKIIFHSGDVLLNEKKIADKQTVSLSAGDTIATADNSYAQIEMLDKAIISIKPNSNFSFDSYSEAKIQLQLERGSIRSVTGQYGEKNKDIFELLTPIVSIGIRGTDFYVHTDNNKSKAYVASGGISLTPIILKCYQMSVACSNKEITELFSSPTPQYVEIRKGETTPVIINGPISTDFIFETSMLSQKARDEISKRLRGESLSLPTPLDIINQYPSQQPNKFILSDGDTSIRWGRWENYAYINSSNIPESAISLANYETKLSNTFYSLLLKRAPAVDKKPGTFNYSIAAAEALLYRGGSIYPAQVNNGKLYVNFNDNTFVTEFTVLSSQMKDSNLIYSIGNISKDGVLSGSHHSAYSNADIKGIHSADKENVGMLFEKTVDSESVISGAINWKQ